RLPVGALLRARGFRRLRGPGRQGFLRLRGAEPEGRPPDALPSGAGTSAFFPVLALARPRLSRVVALRTRPRRVSLSARGDRRSLPPPDGLPELGRGMVARRPLPHSGPLPGGPGARARARDGAVARPLHGRGRL